MWIKVVREGPKPLSYSDINVGEAFTFTQSPESVFLRTSEGALRMSDCVHIVGLAGERPVTRVLMTVTWGP